MPTKSLTRLLIGASLPALAAMTTAAAQDEARRGSIDALTDVITVTATKSQDPEDVQDVPLSVSAYNEASLDALNVRTLEDLSFAAPNVSLDDIGTARGQANFSIRGLGVNSSIGSVDPAVGVFVDGVYLGINSGVVFDTFDVDSVELLRGPQGILFGRNTTGGAVLLNTGNPTDEFEAKVRVATETPVGDDRGGLNTFVMGTVSGPIVPGKLNGKLGAYYNVDNGYFENQFNGENHGEAQTYILRGALEYMPTDNLTFLLKGEYFDNSGDGPSAQNRGTFERDSFDLAIDEEGDLQVEATTISFRTDWDLNFGTITNIFGYRDFEQDTLGDIDALPIFLFHSDSQSEQDQISNEIRYAGTFGRADVKGGFFYFESDLAVNENRNIPGSTSITLTGGGIQEQTVYGLFGQLDYSLTDTLILTGGLRWGREEKEASVAYVEVRPECNVVEGSCPFTGTNPFTGNDNGFVDDDEWENLSPKVGLQWVPNDRRTYYASWTRGYRSGGYNFRITDVTAFENQLASQGGDIATDEEQVDSFEIGTKLQSSDGRAQFNGAVFYTNIEDMQREVNLADPDAAVSQLIANTADATIFGLEFEARYRLTDSTLLLANYGYIDAEYDEVRFDISGDAVVDGADEALAIPRVPENTYGFSIIQEADLGNAGFLTGRLSFQHRDEIAYTDTNFGFIQAADMLDFDVSWQTPVEGLTVSLYGENMLDEVQAGGDTPLPFGGTTPAASDDGDGGLAGPLSDLNDAPFTSPEFGTFSPLKRGRRIGIEATFVF
ncbi:MAG: TonB-dependent receptor [Pseudomonadota bacterium]